MTNGLVAFDYHGYSLLERLLAHHRKGWSARGAGWNCEILAVDFDLLDTSELNKRKMLGPDQYLRDPIERARRFIDRVDHARAGERARATQGN